MERGKNLGTRFPEFDVVELKFNLGEDLAALHPPNPQPTQHQLLKGS